MFGCDGMSDHASWNEIFHNWDTDFSCSFLFQFKITRKEHFTANQALIEIDHDI